MILICGIPSEGPAAATIAAAEEMGVEHVVLNQREVEKWSLELDLEGEMLGGALRGPGGEWGVGEFSGAYLRSVEPAALPEVGDPPDPELLARAESFARAVHAWLEIAPFRVVNRLGPSGSNMSKPYQGQLIAESGLLVPPTTVTNDPSEVRRFVAAHRRVIYKSVSSARSIVRELNGERARDIDRVRHLPTQFQALIPGVDIRVHIVGPAVFATEVRSEAVDYRYAARDEKGLWMLPAELPAEIERRCLALSRTLELPVCGIDLRRTPDGEWYCFEVNPSPAYSFYEDVGGQPIARALVEYLSGAAAEEDDDGAGDRELG